MLKLTNVKKQYHANPIIEIPSLQLESGIYWLSGANGAGKTTLLKMIAALLPFEGDITFNNISLKGQPIMYRQQVGWAEAEPLFPAFITGKDLVSLYRKIRNVEQKDLDNLLELFDITAYVSDAIGTYSAGMTKKLSLVLALLGNPPLIVLDEPLITLDAVATKTVTNFILDMNKTTGCSFLMSSHQDLQEEVAIAGKRLTIHNRTIIVDGASV